MRLDSMPFVSVLVGLLAGGTPLSAQDVDRTGFLAFACDGSARERRVMHEESATWIINQTRAFATTTGRVVYRVPVGGAQLERLRFEVNLVPYQLEFSAEGDRWETLVSTAGVESRPAQFSTEGLGFTPGQREAARASGCAWFRFRPAGGTVAETLQLRHFRLDVRGPELASGFVRPSWWGRLAPVAAGPLMILVGAVPVGLAGWRWRVSWRVWGAGAALWAVSVALKGGFAAVVSPTVNRWLHAALPRAWADPTFWCFVGLLTGIFECGIFLAAAPLIRRRRWEWGEALSLGVAFGAVEAMALGAVVCFSASDSGVWGFLGTWSEALVPAFERLLALLIHVAATVMILRALIEQRWGWFGVSFAYKSTVDGVAAWLLLSGTTLRSSPWAMEWICIAPFALVGVLLTLRLRRGWEKRS